MTNKILVQVLVPIFQTKYDVFIPSNKRLSNVLILLQKAINELSEGWYPIVDNSDLYNQDTGKKYNLNLTVQEVNIESGTTLIII
ncbi:MAG: hypothetical protein RR732_04155 [Bacilli bacterium]